MPAEVLDGFDHTQYREEVVDRWGEEAYERGDRWWRSLRDEEKWGFREAQLRIAQDYARALRDGESPESEEAQAVTRRHVEWLGATVTPSRDYLLGLGELYVTDPRFRENYDRHASGTTAFVREAMAVYAERQLD